MDTGNCNRNGEAQIDLLRHEAYGVYCKKNSVRKFKIASANEARGTRSACSTCLPRIVTSSNVSSEFALLKTTANIKYAALKTAVNNNTIDIHLTFKYGK